jgi:hypothetical protein
MLAISPVAMAAAESGKVHRDEKDQRQDVKPVVSEKVHSHFLRECLHG